VATGAIAVEAADRDMVPWARRDRDVVECRRHGGSVAAQAIRHSLMSACDRIQGIVARRRMTLSARSIGRNVVRRLGRRDVVGKSRRSRMTAAAIPACGMSFIEGGGARVACGCRAAGEHAQVYCGFVTGLTGRNGRGNS